MFKLTDNPFIIYHFWSVNVSVFSDIKRLGKKKKDWTNTFIKSFQSNHQSIVHKAVVGLRNIACRKSLIIKARFLLDIL